MLKPFRVSYFEDAGDKTKLFFYCQAEDSDHAEEQAEVFSPGCVVDMTVELDPAADAAEITNGYLAAQIVIDDGDMFEGTRAEFMDCFFANADDDEIADWCLAEGCTLKINGKQFI